MTRTPIEKLLGRVGHLKAQAKLADARDVAHLRDFPAINPHLVACARKGLAYDTPVYYARAEKRRIQAYARNCRRHARALRKLATHYVYRPGKTEAEMAAAS